MALFESYERRIAQIEVVLEKYGFKTIEECRELCQSKGFDPYEIVKETQAIAFENACWAYTLGAAIAIKKNVKEQQMQLLQLGKVYKHSVYQVLLLTTEKLV